MMEDNIPCTAVTGLIQETSCLQVCCGGRGGCGSIGTKGLIPDEELIVVVCVSAEVNITPGDVEDVVRLDAVAADGKKTKPPGLLLSKKQ